MIGAWWMVVNPRAGQGGDIATRARRALERHGVEAHFEVSTSPDDVAEAVDRGRRAGHRSFGAVGGDGMVNLVLNALLAHEWGEPPILGILPAGRGCDFLRTFAIPQNLELAAAHFRGDDTYLADVARLSGGWGDRHFLNAAQAGIGAATVRTAEGLPRRLGARVYLAAFWLTLPRFRRTEVEVQAGRRSYVGPANNVVMANGQFFGGGLNVAPRSNLVDGELDVQVFTGPLREAVSLIPRVRRGLHLDHHHVRRMSAGEFSVETARPWPVEADGEMLGQTPVRGAVLPGAVAVKI